MDSGHRVTGRIATNTSDVIELWFNLDLRQYVLDTAKSLTRRKMHQEALVGHAWFMLSEADAQKTMQHYKTFCRVAMRKHLEWLKYGPESFT